MTETVLWTNSSPTSNFPNTDVSLSENADNYKFLKILYRRSTSDSTEGAVVLDKDSYAAISDATLMRPCLGSYISSPSYFTARPFRLGSDHTIVKFSQSQTINGTTTYNNFNIPLKIIGLK